MPSSPASRCRRHSRSRWARWCVSSNFSYQGTPSVFIYRRPLANPQSEQAYVNATLAAGGGPKTQTVTDGLPLTIEADNTYSLRINVAPGDSIYGVTVGYQPPTQGFVPFSGANPRVYDSRPIGKLADGEERLVPLGLAGERGAVVNLTLTRTTGEPGYVAVFAGGIPWPGNSSQNWYAAGANVANCVVTVVDAQGRITIRGARTPPTSSSTSSATCTDPGSRPCVHADQTVWKPRCRADPRHDQPAEQANARPARHHSGGEGGVVEVLVPPSADSDRPTAPTPSRRTAPPRPGRPPPRHPTTRPPTTRSVTQRPGTARDLLGFVPATDDIERPARRWIPPT